MLLEGSRLKASTRLWSSDKFGFKGPIEVQSGRCVGISLLGVFGDAQAQAVDQGQALFDAQCLGNEIGHGHVSIVAMPVRCGEPRSVELLPHPTLIAICINPAYSGYDRRAQLKA